MEYNLLGKWLTRKQILEGFNNGEILAHAYDATIYHQQVLIIEVNGEQVIGVAIDTHDNRKVFVRKLYSITHEGADDYLFSLDDGKHYLSNCMRFDKPTSFIKKQ